MAVTGYDPKLPTVETELQYQLTPENGGTDEIWPGLVKALRVPRVFVKSKIADVRGFESEYSLEKQGKSPKGKKHTKYPEQICVYRTMLECFVLSGTVEDLADLFKDLHGNTGQQHKRPGTMMRTSSKSTIQIAKRSSRRSPVRRTLMPSTTSNAPRTGQRS